MARYNLGEKAQIKKQMKIEVMDCLKLYGVRKTSVDELVARVNIPKGTFYLFFPSKEDLFYEVICDYKKDLHLKFYKMLANEKELTCTAFTKIVFEIFKEASNSFLVQIERNNEMEYLYRKLPEAAIQEQESQIEQISNQLLKYIPITDKLEFEKLLHSYEMLFQTALYKNKVDEQLYYGSLWILLNGISMQYLDGGVGHEETIPT